MVLIPKINWLDSQVEYFEKKPTFEMARNIWLYCYDHKKKLPNIVESFFVDKLRSDNQLWLDKISFTLENDLRSTDFDQWIVWMKDEKKCTYEVIADTANHHLPKPKHTLDSIRKRYKRATGH